MCSKIMWYHFKTHTSAKVGRIHLNFLEDVPSQLVIILWQFQKQALHWNENGTLMTSSYFHDSKNSNSRPNVFIYLVKKDHMLGFFIGEHRSWGVSLTNYVRNLDKYLFFRMTSHDSISLRSRNNFSTSDTYDQRLPLDNCTQNFSCLVREMIIVQRNGNKNRFHTGILNVNGVNSENWLTFGWFQVFA